MEAARAGAGEAGALVQVSVGMAVAGACSTAEALAAYQRAQGGGRGVRGWHGRVARGLVVTVTGLTGKCNRSVTAKRSGAPFFATDSDLFNADYSRQFLVSGHRSHMIHWTFSSSLIGGLSIGVDIPLPPFV